MKLRSFIVVVALVLGTLSSAGQSAKPQAAEPVSNTALAERMVQILWEADAPPPDVSGVLGSLFGADTTDLAARILNVKDPAAVRNLVERMGRLEVTDRSCKFGVRVRIAQDGKTPRAAKEFADALVERLSARLRDSRLEAIALRKNRVRNELNDLERKVEETWRQARDKQSKLLVVAGRSDLTVASLQSSLGKLEDERQRLELDLAGMEARLEAVQEQLKAAGEKAKEQLAADPVVGELEKAVAAREKLAKLIQIRVEEGLAPPAEVAKAESDLIEAKVQLLDRKTAASARGGDTLAPLAREMQNLGIDIRDRKARLALVTRKLEPLRNAAEEFQSLEWTQDEVATLRRAMDEARARLIEVERQADAAPVDRVIVVNAVDVTPEPQDAR